MMYSMFSLFSIKVLYTSNFYIFYLWLFSELAILGWFSTWHIKHARIPVCMCFQSKNYYMYVFSKFFFIVSSHSINYLM